MTSCNGLHADRKQALLAIRCQFENLQCQRKKDRVRKDVGYAFVAGSGWRSCRKRYSSSGVGVGRDERVVVREGAGMAGTKKRTNSVSRPVARWGGAGGSR